MFLRLGSWNVGGCLIRSDSSDAAQVQSYSHAGIEYVAEQLRTFDFDVVCLQEVQSHNEYSQVEHLAALAQYPYYAEFVLSPSHLTPGMNLGIGILSKRLLKNVQRTLILNPRKIVSHKNTAFRTHDKGFLSVQTAFYGVPLQFTTLHMLPFYAFQISHESDLFKLIFNDFDEKYSEKSFDRAVVVGDFNFNTTHLLPLLQQMNKSGFDEVPADIPTDSYGRHIDHVLYRGLNVKSHALFDGVMTDHKLVYITINL